ncbi:hypothetical protein [Spirosoma pomorum]
MKALIYSVLMTLVLSCQVIEPDTVAPEYPEWYTVKAPVDAEIQGVWGSLDRTLLITTITNVYRSTDRGNNWQEVLPSQTLGMFGIIQYKDTLYTMTGRYGGALVDPTNYSTDDGKTWKPYRRFNPDLGFNTMPDRVKKWFMIDPVVSSTGVSYKINQVYLDGPTATIGAFETPGVVTSTGRRIDLPHLHQLRSLYLDDRQRLYISGSDAVCGRGHSGEQFSFCNSKNGRGVVYISKNPVP